MSPVSAISRQHRLRSPRGKPDDSRALSTEKIATKKHYECALGYLAGPAGIRPRRPQRRAAHDGSSHLRCVGGRLGHGMERQVPLPVGEGAGVRSAVLTPALGAQAFGPEHGAPGAPARGVRAQGRGTALAAPASWVREYRSATTLKSSSQGHSRPACNSLAPDSPWLIPAVILLGHRHYAMNAACDSRLSGFRLPPSVPCQLKMDGRPVWLDAVLLAEPDGRESQDPVGRVGVTAPPIRGSRNAGGIIPISAVSQLSTGPSTPRTPSG